MISLKESNGFFYMDGNQEVPSELSQSYQNANPFPHIVIDDFLPDFFIDKIINNFPSPNQATVNHSSSTQYLKKGYRPQQLNGNPCIHYLSVLNSAPMLEFLQKLTGLTGLIPDPFYEGGGLHETTSGGKLQIHADFTLHKKLQLARKINMIIFLNKNWKYEYGGNLELWNSKLTLKEQEIVPIYNRCVIFNTSDNSFHGHPTPVDCPPGLTRRSIALYFYTVPENHLTLTSNTAWVYPKLSLSVRLIQIMRKLIHR